MVVAVAAVVITGGEVVLCSRSLSLSLSLLLSVAHVGRGMIATGTRASDDDEDHTMVSNARTLNQCTAIGKETQSLGKWFVSLFSARLAKTDQPRHRNYRCVRQQLSESKKKV